MTLPVVDVPVFERLRSGCLPALFRRPAFWALVLLCVVALAFFAWRLGGDPGAFLYRPGSAVSDLTVTFWPNITYIQRALQVDGALPLWRASIFSGSPFDADPQSGLWYLPNVVFLLLPAAAGFNLLFALHIVAGGTGMWTWSHATGTSQGGALVAALAYAFTPKVFAHLGFGHVGLVYAAAYVPWTMWAAYRVGGGRWCYAGVLGLALGWQFIAHPQLAFYTALAAGTYALSTTLSATRYPPFATRYPLSAIRLLRAVFGLALGAALTLAVAAVQLLPMLRFAPLSARGGMDLAESALSSLPPRYLWGLLLSDHGGFMDYMVYVGLLPLLFALGAVLFVRRRQVAFWAAFVALAAVYALGTHTPLYGLAFRLLPALAWLRAPTRVWFVAAAALALLAGWGADRVLVGVTGRARWWLNLALAGFGGTALFLAAGYVLLLGTPPPNLVALGVLAPLAALLLALLANGRLPRGIALALFSALLLADLLAVDATLIEGRAPEQVFGDTALAEYLGARAETEGPFRVYSPSYSLPRHVAARYGLETADGVDPLFLERYADFMEVASGIPREGYGVTVPADLSDPTLALSNRASVPDLDLLGLLNVRYVAAAFPMEVEGLREVARLGATFLYQNEASLPRAFVVGQVRPVDDFAAAMAWLQAHDARQTAAVQGGHVLNSGVVTSEIRFLHRSANRLELQVDLDHPGFLVLSQVWYPGWRAAVDGQPAAMYVADAVLTGLYLDAGSHSVDFAYRPPALGLGLGCSLGGLGLCAGLGLWPRRAQGTPEEVVE